MTTAARNQTLIYDFDSGVPFQYLYGLSAKNKIGLRAGIRGTPLPTTGIAYCPSREILFFFLDEMMRVKLSNSKYSQEIPQSHFKPVISHKKSVYFVTNQSLVLFQREIYNWIIVKLIIVKMKLEKLMRKKKKRRREDEIL